MELLHLQVLLVPPPAVVTAPAVIKGCWSSNPWLRFGLKVEKVASGVTAAKPALLLLDVARLPEDRSRTLSRGLSLLTAIRCLQLRTPFFKGTIQTDGTSLPASTSRQELMLLQRLDHITRLKRFFFPSKLIKVDVVVETKMFHFIVFPKSFLLMFKPLNMDFICIH